MTAVVLILVSAALQALSNVLQHRAATTNRRGKVVADLIRTMKRGLFLIGVAIILVGFALHIAALGIGSIIVVQPVFVTQLIFILPFSALISHTPITRRDATSAIVVTVSIAAFVLVANPSTGQYGGETGPWIAATVGTVAVCLAFIAVGYRFHGVMRAVLIGIAAGLVNGLLAPVMKAVVEVGGDGFGALLGNWLLYAAIAVAILSFAFPLMAFQSGPITASLPIIMTLNPVAATIFGMWLFGERINDSGVALTLVAASVIVMVVGIVVLSRSEAMNSAFDEGGSEYASLGHGSP